MGTCFTKAVSVSAELRDLLSQMTLRSQQLVRGLSGHLRLVLDESACVLGCALVCESMELSLDLGRKVHLRRGTMLGDLSMRSTGKVAMVRQDLSLELSPELEAVLVRLSLHDALEALRVRLHGPNAFGRLLLKQVGSSGELSAKAIALFRLAMSELRLELFNMIVSNDS